MSMLLKRIPVWLLLLCVILGSLTWVGVVAQSSDLTVVPSAKERVAALFSDAGLENPNQEPEEWIDLFNGKNLDGWTIKICGHPIGENYANTFRVEDGILKCEYDDYKEFGGRYGHLYSNLSYSHYKLRMDYRFEGRQLPDAPKYVDLNSGVMLHSQSPTSVELNQGFPASLEMQFLADLGKGRRQTGNVCTPGTHLVQDGKLIKQHIVKSSGPTFPFDKWVSVEMEVHGHDEIIYRVEGKEVLRYQNPQLDPKSKEAKPIIAQGADVKLSYGHIALQAEAQRVWFRNIKLLPLKSAE